MMPKQSFPVHLLFTMSPRKQKRQSHLPVPEDNAACLLCKLGLMDAYIHYQLPYSQVF